MDKAHKLTDIKLEEIEKKLSEIYKEAKKGIGESWKDYMSEINKEIDGLQKAYDEALKGGNKDEITKKGKKLSSAKRERTIQNKRFKDLTEQTAVELSKVNETALAYINGTLPEVYSLNYNALKESVDGVGGYSFTLVDADTVRNLALNDKSLLPYKKLDPKKDIPWNMKNINSEVLQGIIQGKSILDISKRIMNVQRMNENASIRTARTIVTGAENKGRLDSYQRAQEDGIILEKQWLSAHDSKTRDWHRELDRETADIDKPFVNSVGEIMYPGDPGADPANVYNCRCTLVANVKGFRKADKS